MFGMRVFVFVYTRTCVPVCKDQRLAVSDFLILLYLSIYLASLLFIYLYIYLLLFIYFYTNSVMLSGQHTARSSCFYSLTQYWNHKYLAFWGFFFVCVWLLRIETQIIMLVWQGFPNRATSPVSDVFGFCFFNHCQYFPRI